MKALIDADILQWEFGHGTDSEGKLMPWPFVQARVQARINGILEATDADEYQLYLTSDDKSNFRYKVATIKPYKGNRKTEKPHYYQHIRNFLVDHRGAIEVFGKEADDVLGSTQCTAEKGTTIICSRDKDLDMIPGWHYSWGLGTRQKEKGPWFQDEVGGNRCFYKQCLTGDSVDNIPGLFGVGKSSSLLKKLDEMEGEQEMFDLVIGEYQKRFHSYGNQFFIENAQLLWIMREEDQIWNPGLTMEDYEKED